MSGSTDQLKQSTAAAVSNYQVIKPTQNLYHNTRSASGELTPPEETYEQLGPAPMCEEREGGGSREELEAYISMSAASMRPPSCLPPPHIPYQRDLRFGRHEVQMSNASNCNILHSKKTGALLVQNKKAVFVMVLCLALFLLVSSVALLLGVLSLIKVQQVDGGGGGEDIAARMRSLEQSLGQLQARFQLQSDMSGANETAISTLSLRVDQLGSQLIAVNSSLARQGSSVDAQFNSISSQLNDTSASLASLSNARVELYRGCYKDSSTCRIVRHRTNAYMYVCYTPFLLLDVTVSLLLMFTLLI